MFQILKILGWKSKNMVRINLQAQWGFNHSQNEQIKPKKNTFLFLSFPFKQMGHPTILEKSDIFG